MSKIRRDMYGNRIQVDTPYKNSWADQMSKRKSPAVSARAGNEMCILIGGVRLYRCDRDGNKLTE